MIENMIGEKVTNIKKHLFLSGISEMNNIIAGDANTFLNNSYSLGLRLAPPVVFTGKNVVVATSQFIESSFIECNTNFGELKLSISFQGGLE
jgi:chemotaxis protein CheX